MLNVLLKFRSCTNEPILHVWRVCKAVRGGGGGGQIRPDRKFMCSNISFLPLFFTQVSKWSADDMKGSFILSRKKTDLFNPFYFFSLLLAENVIDINMSVGPSLGSAILASITVQVESMAFFPRFF